MNRNTRSCALLVAIAGTLLAASAAHAADGQIDFTGAVTAQTCEINGGGGASHFSVALPHVSTGALADAGSTAGRTPFSIQLSNCQAGNVGVHFEAGSTVNMATGQLLNSGDAGNVEIRLLNADYSKIQVGRVFASQNSQIVPITAGSATLDYLAEYVSENGSATAGQVTSSVQYTLVYE